MESPKMRSNIKATPIYSVGLPVSLGVMLGIALAVSIGLWDMMRAKQFQVWRQAVTTEVSTDQPHSNGQYGRDSIPSQGLN